MSATPETPTTSTKTGLMDLPPEIRTRIWQYTLFHHETDGIISPLGDTNRECGHVLIDDKRYQFERLNDLSRVWTQGPETTSRKRALQVQQIFHISAASQHKHLCRLDCLVPAALTLVSSQVRTEALPVFYQVNHFHLELEHFELGKRTVPGLMKRKTARALSDWWRATGDTTLRSIRHLTIALDIDVQPFGRSAPATHGNNDNDPRTLVFEVIHHTGDDITRRTATITDRGYWTIDKQGKETGQDRRNKRILAGTLIPQLTPNVHAIEANGLNVHSLENIVADLEGDKCRFLRDYSELDRAALTHGCWEKENAVREATRIAMAHERRAAEEQKLIQEILDREAAEQE